MKRWRFLGGGLAALSMAATGCATADVNAPRGGVSTEPVASDDLFPGAAVFECESGETIHVRFNDEPASATVRRGAGEVLELPLQERNEVETYQAGVVSLGVGPGETEFSVGGETTACDGVSRAIGPPRIVGVTQDLRQSDDGQTIMLVVGDTFSVSLVGVPTAGYQWTLANAPRIVSPAGETGGPTSTAQYLPGFAGGNHWEVFTFRALAAGRGELVLEERRPFEGSDEPAADRFRALIVVQ